MWSLLVRTLHLLLEAHKFTCVSDVRRIGSGTSGLRRRRQTATVAPVPVYCIGDMGTPLLEVAAVLLLYSKERFFAFRNWDFDRQGIFKFISRAHRGRPIFLNCCTRCACALISHTYIMRGVFDFQDYHVLHLQELTLKRADGSEQRLTWP